MSRAAISCCLARPRLAQRKPNLLVEAQYVVDLAFATLCSVDCLRVSLTDRCNLRCLYCMPPKSNGRKGDVGDNDSAPAEKQEAPPADSSFQTVLRFEEIAAIVRFLRERYGLRTVRLTGGEPLVRRGIVELTRMLAGQGLADLAMTTNGQVLSDYARPLREAGLRRVNISLDTLDRGRFSRLTRGGRLERTLAGIDAARAAGFRSIKINTVVLRGENDREVCDLVRFAMARGLEIRFLELMAIGVAAARYDSWFVSSREVLERLACEFRVAAAVEGESPERVATFRAEGAAGRSTRVGFISPMSRPFCAGCRRLRLTADGQLRGCLMQGSGPELAAALRRAGGPDYAALERMIARALRAKPARRELSSPYLMAGIGG